jgi:hypothetical protein
MIALPEPLLRYSSLISVAVADESLAFWNWCLPATSRAIFATKFGDWFLQTDAGEVHFLDILEGRCCAMDASINEITSGDFVSKYPDLLSVDWIDIMTSKGYVLSQDECFGWKVHPMLGGALASTNIQVFTFRVYQSISSQLHQQFHGGKSDNP